MLTRTASNYVLGNLSYLVPQADKPFNFMYEPAPGVLRQNCQYRRHACAIHTARPIADSISLAVQGFELPEMDPNEVLIFKHYDSRKDQGARRVPHCAFDIPVSADVPLRRSIEVRCLVLLD
jgi:hypothetical protein